MHEREDGRERGRERETHRRLSVCIDGHKSKSTYNCVCCSVLQCVAVCCSVLQCVAVCCSTIVYDIHVSVHVCSITPFTCIRTRAYFCILSHLYTNSKIPTRVYDMTTSHVYVYVCDITPIHTCMYTCVNLYLYSAIYKCKRAYTYYAGQLLTCAHKCTHANLRTHRLTPRNIEITMALLSEYRALLSCCRAQKGIYGSFVGIHGSFVRIQSSFVVLKNPDVDSPREIQK